jgi:predicted CoA-binding protein
MLQHGYDIIPINPNAHHVFGRPAYRALADVPGEIDMVNVFRPSEEAADVARQAAMRGAKALWLQLGIRSDEARRIAEAAGMAYVENRCVKIELHRR